MRLRGQTAIKGLGNTVIAGSFYGVAAIQAPWLKPKLACDKAVDAGLTQLCQIANLLFQASVPYIYSSSLIDVRPCELITAIRQMNAAEQKHSFADFEPLRLAIVRNYVALPVDIVRWRDSLFSKEH